MVRDGGGLRGRPVRVAVADAFGVGFLSADEGKEPIRQGKVGVGEKGALARRKYRAQRPLARVVVAMVYPFAARAVEPGGPALMGKGRVLRGYAPRYGSAVARRRPGRSVHPVPHKSRAPARSVVTKGVARSRARSR